MRISNKSGHEYMFKLKEITEPIINEKDVIDILDHKEHDNQIYYNIVLNIRKQHIIGWIKEVRLAKYVILFNDKLKIN